MGWRKMISQETPEETPDLVEPHHAEGWNFSESERLIGSMNFSGRSIPKGWIAPQKCPRWIFVDLWWSMDRGFVQHTCTTHQNADKKSLENPAFKSPRAVSQTNGGRLRPKSPEAVEITSNKCVISWQVHINEVFEQTNMCLYMNQCDIDIIDW